MVTAAIAFLIVTILMDKGFISTLAWYVTLFIAVVIMSYHIAGLFRKSK